MGIPNNLIEKYKIRMPTPLDQVKDWLTPLLSSESASYLMDKGS